MGIRALEGRLKQAAEDTGYVGAKVATKINAAGQVVVAVILTARYTPLDVGERRPRKS